LRANVLVREIGRGRGVEERSLEMTECHWEVEEGDGDRNLVCKVQTHYSTKIRNEIIY